jgi:hypothetical protein
VACQRRFLIYKNHKLKIVSKELGEENNDNRDFYFDGVSDSKLSEILMEKSQSLVVPTFLTSLPLTEKISPIIPAHNNREAYSYLRNELQSYKNQEIGANIVLCALITKSREQFNKIVKYKSVLIGNWENENFLDKSHSPFLERVILWITFMKERKLKPDIHLFNSFLENLYRKSQSSEFITWIYSMEEMGVIPNAETYKIFFYFLFQEKRFVEVIQVCLFSDFFCNLIFLQVFQKMNSTDIPLTPEILQVVLSAVGSTKNWQGVLDIVSHVEEIGMELKEDILDVIFTQLGEMGQISKLISWMKSRTKNLPPVSLSVPLTLAHFQNSPMLIVEFFDTAREKGMKNSFSTMKSALKLVASAPQKKPLAALQIYSIMKKESMELDQECFCTILDLLKSSYLPVDCKLFWDQAGNETLRQGLVRPEGTGEPVLINKVWE